MKTKKWVFIVLALGIIAVTLAYDYIYQDHRDIESEAPAFTISAIELSIAFQEDETAATQTYLNKTILVEGIVSAFDNETVTMEPGVFFAVNKNEHRTDLPSLNTNIQIKGRCIGYDSILEEIKFDQSIFIN